MFCTKFNALLGGALFGYVLGQSQSYFHKKFVDFMKVINVRPSNLYPQEFYQYTEEDSTGEDCTDTLSSKRKQKFVHYDYIATTE
ncbi:hypothetical protein PV327_008138 [Microctonus hyperodae]|uniref:Uncharacterized protein n=1 Tax=Microctonus hyperodae TaxID=165561 RepID=A0AA39F2H0_MICHY|nr:hypothetical protein PV327_008138 [Microctonus hyperodae]